MNMTLLVHILAGTVGIGSGFVALFAAKGNGLHRRSGRLFVFAMLIMCLLGGLLAALAGTWAEVNIPAAILTAYLVTTALITVRPPAGWRRWMDLTLLLVALAVGLFALTLGLLAIAQGGKWRGIPAFPFFMFAAVGLLGSVGDLRWLRRMRQTREAPSSPAAPSTQRGTLRGAPRLARHLWRMCFALYIAAASFFLGQADTLPEALREPALLAVPVLVPILAIFYWLWRVRAQRTQPGARRGRLSEAMGQSSRCEEPRAS